MSGETIVTGEQSMKQRNLDRRDLLRAGVATAAAAIASPAYGRDAEKPEIVTVTGSINADELGVTLPHEHVLVDFVGADRVTADRYDRDEAFRVILPHLKRVHELGGQSIVECTPAYLGRDPRLLKRLSEASGVRLLTNTGYYGARKGKFLPEHAFSEDANSLAERWFAEWQNGIEDTAVRPGFVKIGVDSGRLTDVNRKLVQAAARTHLRTGLTIAGHTGDGKAALEQLEVLQQEGVGGTAWIWVHAQNEKDTAVHRQVAERGAWVSLDGVSPTSLGRHLEMILQLKQADLLHRALISHDAGWYSVGEPRGGTYRGYETVFTEFLPTLRRNGFTQEEVQQLTVSNPANAFTIRVRER